MQNECINKVNLTGYLAKEPDIRPMAKGGYVANITINTTFSWKVKNEVKTKNEFHRVVVFNQEFVEELKGLQKDALISVEGKLQTRNWEDNNGVKKYTTEIVLAENNSVLKVLRGDKGEAVEENQDDLDDDSDIPF
jgi:single-strand DNA-binding protein